MQVQVALPSYRDLWISVISIFVYIWFCQKLFDFSSFHILSLTIIEKFERNLLKASVLLKCIIHMGPLFPVSYSTSWGIFKAYWNSEEVRVVKICIRIKISACDVLVCTSYIKGNARTLYSDESKFKELSGRIILLTRIDSEQGQKLESIPGESVSLQSTSEKYWVSASNLDTTVFLSPLHQLMCIAWVYGLPYRSAYIYKRWSWYWILHWSFEQTF